MTETRTAAPKRGRAAGTRVTATKTAAKRPAVTKKAQAAPDTDTPADEAPAAKGTAAVYEHVSDSANYSVWKAPDDSGFTGKVYAPKGVKKVTVFAE